MRDSVQRNGDIGFHEGGDMRGIKENGYAWM